MAEKLFSPEHFSELFIIFSISAEKRRSDEPIKEVSRCDYHSPFCSLGTARGFPE
jgi:hypothetical protein